MMKTKQIVKNLWGESTYDEIAFEDLVKFYKMATAKQIQGLNNACMNDEWDNFKELIEKVVITPIPPSTIDYPPGYLAGSSNRNPKS